MRVMKFRILLDTKEDVFRDLEIPEDSTLRGLHEHLLKSFGLSGEEMASFFISDDQWSKGKEYPLIDMGDEEEEQVAMDSVKLNDLVEGSEELKLIYIYDFLNMWIFCLDMVKRFDAEKGKEYPRVALAIGDPPEEGPMDPLKGLSPEADEDEEDDEDPSRDEGDIGSDVDDLFKDL